MPISDNDPRVFFAAERTLLAWMRTAIALIGLGFVVARFGLFLRLVRQHDGGEISHHLPSVVLGMALSLLGAFAAGMATYQHRRFCRSLGQTDLPPGFRAPEHALPVYRIGQEALRNVARHAGVTGARVSVVARDGQLVLTIRDDGRGFDPGVESARGTGAGLGLLTMSERAIQAGGSADIRSAPGKGTTVRVALPLRGPA